jgi:hypothetical protein
VEGAEGREREVRASGEGEGGGRHEAEITYVVRALVAEVVHLREGGGG